MPVVGFGMAMRKNESAARAIRERHGDLARSIREGRKDRLAHEVLAPVQDVTCMVCGIAGTTLNMAIEDGGYLCFGCEVDNQVRKARGRRVYNTFAVAMIVGWTLITVGSMLGAGLFLGVI